MFTKEIEEVATPLTNLFSFCAIVYKLEKIIKKETSLLFPASSFPVQLWHTVILSVCNLSSEANLQKHTLSLASQWQTLHRDVLHS